MKTKFKISAVDFKRESYKFIFNDCPGFTEIILYSLLSIVNKQHSSEFPKMGLHLAMKIIFLFNFLQLFYKYLAAEFFPDINS